MTIEIKGTKNYSATIIKVPALRKVENSDRLYIAEALGIRVIVDSGWLEREGELAVLFPAEAQLSHLYVQRNNLFRHNELNDDVAQSGYIEDNRRVRALKLRGSISYGLLLPLASLDHLRAGVGPLREGDVFDTLAGEEVCRKYVIETKEPQPTRGERQVKKAFKRVDETFLPEHFETGQWEREKGNVAADANLIVTQKLHGTSVRLANTVVKRQLTKRERFAKKFLGAKIKDHEYDLVAGSRKVIKDPNNPEQAHFYGEDVWTESLADFGDNIPKNHVIYGELVGYTVGGRAIQAGHTYECDRDGIYIGERTQLYVYRVAIITEDADLVDLSWTQVKAFCQRHSLKNVPELAQVKKMNFYVEDFTECEFYDVHAKDLATGGLGYNERPVMISEGGTGVDEGIAIRVEGGMVPEFYKFKNPSHYLYESGQLDTGAADLESQG